MTLLREFGGKLRRDGPMRASLGVVAHVLGRPTANRLAVRIAAILGNRVTLHGVRLDLGDDRVDADTTRAILTGGYESEERWLIARHVGFEANVVELGAGMGYVSCYIARNLEGGAELISVEADPDLADLVANTRSRNGLDFHLYNRAYYPGVEEVTFATGDTLLLGRVEDIGGDVVVPATTLGALVAEHGWSLFDLVADIEGAETELVDAEIDLLKERCRTIIMELHEVEPGARERVESRLVEAGFRRIDSVANVVAYANEALEGT